MVYRMSGKSEFLKHVIFMKPHYSITTVCPRYNAPRYNAPRYNADSGITRSTVAPENKPARGFFFFS